MLTTSSMKAIIAPTFSAIYCHHLPKLKNPSLSSYCLQSESVLCNNPFRVNPRFMCTKSMTRPLLPNISPVYTQNRSVQMEPLRPLSGEIHVIVGPMFAGKTTTLLRRIQLETSNGRRVAVIKSSKDKRYGSDSIVTHDGEKFPCWPITELSSFRRKIGLEAYEELDVIGIDEAQFFGDLYDFCHEAADRDGKMLIVAGLDGDYLRRSFGSVLDIIPLADSVTKLNARCEHCGGKAFFTLRKTQDTQTELIGGADVYMPVCRQHYVGGQVVMKAAKYILETQKIRNSSLT